MTPRLRLHCASWPSKRDLDHFLLHFACCTLAILLRAFGGWNLPVYDARTGRALAGAWCDRAGARGNSTSRWRDAWVQCRVRHHGAAAAALRATPLACLAARRCRHSALTVSRRAAAATALCPSTYLHAYRRRLRQQHFTAFPSLHALPPPLPPLPSRRRGPSCAAWDAVMLTRLYLRLTATLPTTLYLRADINASCATPPAYAWLLFALCRFPSLRTPAGIACDIALLMTRPLPPPPRCLYFAPSPYCCAAAFRAGGRAAFFPFT